MCPLLAQDPLHSIRPTHDVTSYHTARLAITRWQLFESVLADPQVELRARQPKPPRGFRFVPRHSCRTLAIVVRSRALRSVVSLREGLAAGLQGQMLRRR